MGRREAGDSSTVSTSERTELESLQGIASSDDPSVVSGGMAHQTDKKSSCQPVRPPVEVKKHQHKHNLKHRYEVMETLGKGTYGKVKKAVERKTGKTVAIKSIRKERIIGDLDRIHIQREIEIISSLRHPNIICIHEVFESKDKIVIVMELATGGELYDYISGKQRLSETEARKIFRQITSAVHHCHKNHVVHRDLKLENILLDQDCNVKLADFGLSSRYQKGELLKTYCGSPLYASPEIVKGVPYQGPEVDCWALGVLLYALVYGSMPFDGASYSVLTEQISHGQYRRPQPPSDACMLIDWMLTVDMEQRATVEDIANHWWVNWGFQETVCDCPSRQGCPSPLLARYIDLQNRALCSCPSPAQPNTELQPPHHLPLKPGAGWPPSAACLKKSRKEYAMSQANRGTGTLPGTEKNKPKGILKAQSSSDTTRLPRSASAESLPQNSDSPRHAQQTPRTQPGNSQTLPAYCQPSSKTPKKGILKKLYKEESGLSSSPERRDSLEKTGCRGSPPTEGKQAQTEAVRRRKGILKWNGKFSTSLELSDGQLASLQHVLSSSRGSCDSQSQTRHSRPSSMVSEDSFLSNDSFDVLDLSMPPQQRPLSQGNRRGVYGSQEEQDVQTEDRVERREGRRQQKDEEVKQEAPGKKTDSLNTSTFCSDLTL